VVADDADKDVGSDDDDDEDDEEEEGDGDEDAEDFLRVLMAGFSVALSCLEPRFFVVVAFCLEGMVSFREENRRKERSKGGDERTDLCQESVCVKAK
jgi:hypothetical protein